MSAETKTRKRLTGAERREQLLDAAKAVVAAQGFHGASIEAIAREAGITRPIVYAHFEHLDELFDAMVKREGQRALAQLAQLIPGALDLKDPREALVGALRGYLEAVRADPGTWRLVLMPPESAPAVLREQINDGRAAVVAVLAQLAGQETGIGLPSPDPELTGRLISTIADESARLMLTQPAEFPIERLLAHARWLLNQIREA